MAVTIEIAICIVDCAEGGVTDRAAERCVEHGDIRRITTIAVALPRKVVAFRITVGMFLYKNRLPSIDHAP